MLDRNQVKNLKVLHHQSSIIVTCLYPLAERAMANLRPSLVKTGASSSSNQPPGDVMIKLSWQSPLWRECSIVFRSVGKGRVSGHLFVEVVPEGFADGHHAVVLVPVLPGERHLVLGEEAKFN